MNRLILHIGTHKTGSSAIQNWLWQRRAALHRQGFHYGATDREPHPHLPKHNSLYRSLVHPKGDFAAEKAAILADFRQSGCDTMILSEEGLCEPYYERLARIAELRAHFEIIVVCFLRRQDYFLESLWNQRCREGLESRPIGEFAAAGHNRLLADYAGKLNFWSRVGEVRAIGYDEAAESSVEAFADLMGLRHDGIPAVVNPSPSMNCAVCCNLLNRWRIRYPAQEVIRSFRHDSRRHALGGKLRKALLDDFAPANARLAERFGITFDHSMPAEPRNPLRWPNPFVVLKAVLAGVFGRGPG